MEREELKPILESLLFISTEPLSPAELKRVIQNRLKKREELEEKAQSEGSEGGEILGLEDGNHQEDPLDLIGEESYEEELESPLELVQAESENDDDANDTILAQLSEKQEELDNELSASEIRSVLDEMVEAYANDPTKGIEIVRVAKGYQFRSKEDMTFFIKGLFKVPKPKMSAPSMETLAIVAYQQPLTRARVEEIRGVDSGGVFKTLLEKDFVRIVGRSDEAGKPILYGTTKKFLEVFGLNSLSDLPNLKDLDDLDQTVAHDDDDDSSMHDQLRRLDSENDDDGDILDEASSELLDELESSMKSLKSLEKEIFKPEESEDTVSVSSEQEGSELSN